MAAMRNALRRLVIALVSVVVIFAVFAAGMGLYAAVLALSPLVVVWWPRLLAGAGAVVALGAWWLWWRLPKRQMRSITAADPKARADIEDNFRKTIGQLLGGAAVLIGAGFAYLQFTQQQRSSHDVLISNQVAKGFDLLGNKDQEPMQRLGGIYALEGVMNNSEDYHEPVLEALSAFVRAGTKTETGESPPTDDIQAALTVIRRRKSGFTEQPLDLDEAHIPEASLMDANLSAARLNGADLIGANLRDADLSFAFLRGASLSRAYLSGANLTRAILLDANLTHANLTHANLTHANLSIAYLYRANLTGAELGGAHLNGAELTGANLTEASLNGADLGAFTPTGAWLTAAGAPVPAIPTGANLTGTNLSGADLTGAIISQTQLDQACGTDAKLDPGLTIKPCLTSP
jgi:uncharacterized protein YjbI with pentapeptide repeats